MLIVRLKQCEVALAGGRLDEAFELARQPDLRAHRRGQELVGRIGRALLERGRVHLAAGQLVAAAQDCEKAAHVGGNMADVVQLRSAVSNAMADQRRREHACQEVLATARRHADIGQISVSEQVLAAAPVADERAESLKRDLAARRAAVRSVAEKAGALLEADDWEAATQQIAALDRALRCDPAIRQIASQINQAVVGRATKAFETGRLDVAGGLLSAHESLPGQWADADHLRSALRQCREALDRTHKSDTTGAEQILRALSRQWPGAAWIEDALAQARRLRDATDELITGPLRLAGTTRHAAAIPPIPAAPAARANGAKAADFLLHVDGVGGFRVIGRPEVTLGPVSASRPVDVPLMADASLPVITITRSEHDYFLQSRQRVTVNDKAMTSKLLCSGDRIALGPRCRITFRRPSAASGSAVLDLSGTRLPRGDVRQVILMDRELIVGPGASAHIRCDDLAAPAVLQGRDGYITCRAGDPIVIDGRPAGTSAEVLPGAHVSIGTLGLVVAKEA